MQPDKRASTVATGVFRTVCRSALQIPVFLYVALIAVGGMWSVSQAQISKSASANASEKWSLQVDEVGSSEVSLDPAFRASIYENLLIELAKSGKFEQVFRSGDRRASSSPDLLILQITVRKFDAGSETKRAVTTFAGATKIKVESQLLTRDGQVVKDDFVEGDVRFIGSNLRATHNLARNVAKIINKATLPDPNLRPSRVTSSSKADVRDCCFASPKS